MFNECTHLKADGTKCHSPAMRGTSRCFYHTRIRRRVSASNRPKDEPFGLPDITEPGMLLIALNEILQAIAAGRISARRAGALLYGIQMANRELDGVEVVFPAPIGPPLPAASAHAARQKTRKAPERCDPHPGPLQ